MDKLSTQLPSVSADLMATANTDLLEFIERVVPAIEIDLSILQSSLDTVLATDDITEKARLALTLAARSKRLAELEEKHIKTYKRVLADAQKIIKLADTCYLDMQNFLRPLIAEHLAQQKHVVVLPDGETTAVTRGDNTTMRLAEGTISLRETLEYPEIDPLVIAKTHPHLVKTTITQKNLLAYIEDMQTRGEEIPGYTKPKIIHSIAITPHIPNA